MILELLLPITGAVGLFFAYRTYAEIQAQSAGADKMKEIASSIREGALTFLKKEASYLILFIAIVFLLLWAALG